MKWNRIAAGCLLYGVGFSLSACARRVAPPPPEAVPVTAASVERKSVPVEVTAIGHVEAHSTVGVKSQVNGTLMSVGFREGQDVKQGDLLFRIDPRPFEATLAQAQANLARDRAQARNAASEIGRYETLVEKDYVTREQYDQVKATAEALASTVQASEAAVENARLLLSWCTITAPISGRTGSLLLHAGNVVKANDDKPMVVINEIQPVYVTFASPEAFLADLQGRPGRAPLAVMAAPAGDPSHPRKGELSFVDNAVDATTGTITLKATYDNRDSALWPGQYVNVAVTLATRANSIVIPAQAVQNSQRGQYVFVVKNDNGVEMRTVSIAQAIDQQLVIDKGVSAGETVVTDGQLKLTPKSKVEVKQSL